MALGGAITGHLVGMSKKLKPTLHVSAFVDTFPQPKKTDESKFLRQDLKRCKEECAAIEKALDEWVPEDVAARAEKSLRAELKRKQARMDEIKESLEELESDDEDEEEEEDDEEESD